MLTSKIVGLNPTAVGFHGRTLMGWVLTTHIGDNDEAGYIKIAQKKIVNPGLVVMEADSQPRSHEFEFLHMIRDGLFFT